MAINKSKFDNVIDELTIGTEKLRDIACSFRREMEKGLEKDNESSLKMLNSYIGMPKGDEQGDLLALDFGGTNLRILHIRLTGNCQHEVVKKVARPLVTADYNLICKDAKADELFDFIADMVAEAIEGLDAEKIYLGHTFSFPSIQENIYNARLIVWTKEFAVPGVEGEVVNDLLKAALSRKGIKNVEPNSVINDTVAVLLAAAYQYPDTKIGVIYATGYNACYFEKNHKDGSAPSIINMESGNFDKLLLASCDKELNAKSENPENQHLEKMVSGRYMGELLTNITSDLLGVSIPASFTAIDISAMLDDDEALTKTAVIVREKTGMELAADEIEMIRDVADALSTRSARLAAAAMVGPIWHIAGKGEIEEQHIAVDGSVFEHMPNIPEKVNRALSELLGVDAAKVHPVLVTGGSGVGAAIAAEVASKA